MELRVSHIGVDHLLVFQGVTKLSELIDNIKFLLKLLLILPIS